jgi:SSS family solute:Na+ symporter
MLIAQTVGIWEIVVLLAYLFLVLFLGWLGYKKTKNATDYLLGGRTTHPVIMALSYGSTFISTSAIVGFGGVAGMFGMSLLWLTFLNIFVGIFIAFVFLGGPTRRIGHRLDAHTFPELMGRRFQSKFIQIFAGLTIFLFIPLYAAAVMIGGCKFIEESLGMDYNVALLLFTIITAAYVVTGGLKGVMYTDALQGVIMFVGMIILLVFTYIKLGGITPAHQALTDMASLVPSKLTAIGHRGWTAMPAFGFGDVKYNLWWTIISTITLGVGIGVLAQPQLTIRFMTVKSKKELNRAVVVGGVFILIMTGVAFTVGSLSNVFFLNNGADLIGRVVNTIDQAKGYAVIQTVTKDEAGKYVDDKDKDGKAKMAPVKLSGVADAATGIVTGKSISVIYAAGGDVEKIIPNYIKTAMPGWFGLLFLLTLLSAAMSTLSSQFHVVGTSIGRDVYETSTGKHGQGIGVTRTGIVIGIIIALLWSYYARSGGMIIARATSIFFGLCASAFLPAYFGALFFKRATKAGAIASMITGFIATTFWLVFVNAKEAETIGLVQKITGGKTSILADYPNWPVVDQIVVALPVSILVMIIVSLITKKSSHEHLERCYGK